VETKQSGALRSNDQMQIETLHEQQRQPPPTARTRSINRPNYDNDVSPQQQQQRNGFSSMASGGRRVVPGKAFDEANG
jgi:hypothetical protein